MYGVLLIYSLLYMPTMALTNALAFRQMKDPSQDFGSIRALGTAGWIVAGLTIGGISRFFVPGVEATAIPLRMAAVASILFGLYALTLPHTPPLGTAHGFKVSNIFPADVFNLFKNRNFAIFALAAFLICIPLQFYYAFTNPFLNEIGVKYAAAKMTMGQMSELLFMLALAFFFKRIGVKYTLMLGMFAWVARYLMFGYGNSGPLAWMLYIGIILHGICYDFFFVMGYIYVDQKAPAALRAAAQGLMTFLTYGIGMFVGSLICGRIVDMYAISGPGGAVVHNWRNIWMVPAFGAAVVLVIFWLGFRREEATEARAPQSALAPE
jgi:nucleoside transporter